MQEVFSKEINLTPKCLSLYDRLKHLNQIRSLRKADEEEAELLGNYKKLALELGCSTQQIRRYLIELENLELIKRHYVSSNSSMYICFLKFKNTNKKGAAL